MTRNPFSRSTTEKAIVKKDVKSNQEMAGRLITKILITGEFGAEIQICLNCRYYY